MLARLRRMGPRRDCYASTACSPSRSGTAASGRLTLARDRFGVKPVYYAQVDGALLFASEIKAFRAYPGVPHADRCRGIDRISHASRTSSPIAPLFDGVRLLPAAATCRSPLDADGAAQAAPLLGLSFRGAGWARSTRRTRSRNSTRLFRQAVNRQLVSDVTLALISPAAWIPARSPRLRSSQLAAHANVHRRLRPQLRVGRRARL